MPASQLFSTRRHTNIGDLLCHAGDQYLFVQDLKRQHKQTLARFMEAEKEHKQEAEWKQGREDAARKAAEEAEEAKALEKVQSAAVCIIQAHWRGLKARQAAKGGKDGAKLKKGKSKK